MRCVILLHRIRDGYLTMVDLFRTVISPEKLEEMLMEVSSRFSSTNYIGIAKDVYGEDEALRVYAQEYSAIPRRSIDMPTSAALSENVTD